MNKKANIYLKKSNDTFSFSDVYIYTPEENVFVETLYYDRGVERLGNVYYQKIVETVFPISLLV